MNPTRWTLLFLVVAAVAFAGWPAAALAQRAGTGDGPSTRPGSRQNETPRRQRTNANRAFRVIAAAAESFDLTNEQAAKLDATLAGAMQDLRRLSPGLRLLQPPERRKRMRAFRATVMAEVAEILDESDRPLLEARVREEMRTALRNRDEADHPTTRPNRPADAAEDERGMSAMMGAAGAVSDDRPIAPSPTDSRFLDRLEKPTGVTVGDRLPDGLQLLTLQNRRVSLESRLAEHRPTVILLGSASSPTFRDRVGDLAWLRSALSTPSGRSGDVLLIYTREQYPAGDWNLDRNEADGFVIPRHADAEARTSTAMNLRRWGGLDWPGLQVVADTMDNATLVALTGSTSAVGNFAFVVTPDGTVIGRQDWFDPTGIPALVALAE